MASELDLTKALTLNGEQLLDKKLKIEKARSNTKVESKKKKVKPLAEDEKGSTTQHSLPSQSFHLLNFVPPVSDFMASGVLAEKNTRCLFLRNVPYAATKDEIQKVFPEAVDIRFPGRTKAPRRG